MNNIDRVKYWIDLATDDLSTAKILFKKRKLLFSGFLCHLTIEKGLKALVAKTTPTPPKSHDLEELAKKANVYDIMSEEQKDFIDTLQPLNIEARYPAYKENISSSLDKTTCKEILKETEILLKWIKTQL
ncbi:MAG: HEPN domain-containing protein [Oscillospiraceae bacterium]|jgi:HEPN domain-containing protein|nr:HEPN domain-containing protein [Oscillospiraceae bacterium]